MLDVAKRAIRDSIITPRPLNAFSAAKDNGASDNDSPFHHTKAEVHMATKIYKVIAKAMEISMAIGIILAGFLVSSAILTIFSNP